MSLSNKAASTDTAATAPAHGPGGVLSQPGQGSASASQGGNKKLPKMLAKKRSATAQSSKSMSQSPLNLIVGKIHRAHTTASDELFMRGYISQDTRMAVGGLVGSLLQGLRTQAMSDLPELMPMSVDPDCVDAIANEKQRADAATFTTKHGNHGVDESLNDTDSRIRDSFYDEYWLQDDDWTSSGRGDSVYPMSVSMPPFYVLEVHPDFLIICADPDDPDDSYMRVGYSDGANEVVFDAPDAWQNVEPIHDWVNVTKQARSAYERASLKEGRRHSAPDQANVQTIHDAAVELGAVCATDEPLALASDESGSFSVVKSATGYRWVLASSSAYQDFDGEIVSEKALQDDVERADKSGEYGPLLWWHCKELVLGQCLGNAMHGRVLIEWGEFASKEVGEAFEQVKQELGVSLGFLHPASEPAEGVFYHIRRKERSLLPMNKASNRVVALLDVTKETTMGDITEEKKNKLRAFIGDAADSILGRTKAADAAAAASGLTAKEQGGGAGAAAAKPTASAAAQGDAPAADARTVAQLTVTEFTAELTKGMAPLVDALKTALGTAQQSSTKQQGEVAEVREGVTTLAEAMGERLKAVDTKLDTLLGEQPAGVARPGFRPSQDQSTTTTRKNSDAGGGDSNQSEADMVLSLVDRLDGRSNGRQQSPRSPMN